MLDPFNATTRQVFLNFQFSSKISFNPRILAIYYGTLGASICEQLGNLKNLIYPRLLTQSLLSPTSSASDLRLYYTKLVRAKETPLQQMTPTLTSPHSCSFSPTSTSPTTSPSTLTSTTSTTSVVPALRTIYTVSLEEGLSCDILVDLVLLLATTVSKDHLNNQSEHHHWYLRLGERWEHVKHLFKPSPVLCFDLALCSIGVRLGMRVRDFSSARNAAFKFIDLTDHPMFVFINLHPAFVVPILEYFEEVKDTDNLSFFLSRLRPLHNASYLKIPSLATILERINQLLDSSLPPVHA